MNTPSSVPFPLQPPRRPQSPLPTNPEPYPTVSSKPLQARPNNKRAIPHTGKSLRTNDSQSVVTHGARLTVGDLTKVPPTTPPDEPSHRHLLNRAGNAAERTGRIGRRTCALNMGVFNRTVEGPMGWYSYAGHRKEWIRVVEWVGVMDTRARGTEQISVRAAVGRLVEGGGVGHSQPVWDDDGGARSCSSLMDRCTPERNASRIDVDAGGRRPTPHTQVGRSW
jgi:hypothetical protein